MHGNLKEFCFYDVTERLTPVDVNMYEACKLNPMRQIEFFFKDVLTSSNFSFKSPQN